MRFDVHIHSGKLDEISEQLKSIRHKLARIDSELEEFLARGRPVKMDLVFGGPQSSTQTEKIQGDVTMAAGRETDTQTIPCSAIETDADGNPVTLNAANVVWSIDDTTLASVTTNPDGSASFKALKVGGPATVSCTDNGVTPPLVGTNTLEVVASTKTATAMALVFGDPQASTA